MSQSKIDYEKEKAAVRLYEFYKRFDNFLAVYVELKMYYPELATHVEEQYPFLVDMYNDAREQYRNRSDTAPVSENGNAESV